MKIWWKSIIFIFVLISCQHKNDNPYLIDLENQLQSNQRCTLSDLADSISYIFLETSDNSLLPNISAIVYLDSNDIFVRGGNYVYRFSGIGKFLNRIGAVGMGPKEYPSLQEVSIDPYNKQLLLLSQSGHVYIYGYDGNFVKKLHLEGEISAINSLNDNSFVCEVRDYNDSYRSSLIQFDKDGAVIKKIEIEKDNLNFSRSLQTVSLMFNTNNSIKFKSLYNDTLFSYNKLQLTPHKILNLGRLSPSRDLIENVDKKNELLSKYAQIVDIVESENYLFLLIIMNEKLNGVIVDKDNNKVVYNQEIENPRAGGGIDNDLNNSGKFWPMLSSNNQKNSVVQLVHPVYTKMENTLTDDANPILQVVYLK
ncbi:6-bladed beta-propeller [Parapedobacter koreensis]|uniref:6-bladed beta-propeller protein n=1 Tax=Parapedobacter koreensis TaxID=332977 RepID=A0A1H7F7J5_9SPHI|nr:6-bladed beta-propeller [Parapedobacter koreensis]SEK19970.1 6-bladed beta-propeller protein [Parapedobacter koreensis]